MTHRSTGLDYSSGAHRVAVLATPSLETVVAVVGCLLAGVAVVPVPSDAGPSERAHLLRDSGAQLWFGERPDDVQTPGLTVDLRARSSHCYPEPDGAATAFILYTSGTTGAPKGVQLSGRAIAAALDALRDAWAWTAEDLLVHGLPLFHVHGLILGVLGALRVGSPVVHTVCPSPQAYATAGGSLYFGVPTVWGRVCADPGSARALAGARLLVSGSAALPTSVFTQLRSLTGAAPVERYGMSETLITLSTRADGERRPGWVGATLPGVRSRLRDEHGDPVPEDGRSIGELQVRAPSLFNGYLNRAEASAAAWTADGWFRTGDVAVIDSGRFHRIVGRHYPPTSSRPVDTVSAQERWRPHCSNIRMCSRPPWWANPMPTSGNASWPTWWVQAWRRSTSPDSWPTRFRSTSVRGRYGWWTRCPATPWARCRRPCSAVPMGTPTAEPIRLVRGKQARTEEDGMGADDTAGQARKGLVDSVRGKAKEVFGALSGNDSLTSEGQLQQRQAQDRKEASSTQSLADAQAQEAAEQLSEARQEGAERRSDVGKHAAAEKSDIQLEQEQQRRAAEHQQVQETAAGQAGARHRADEQVRAASAEQLAEEAAATQTAAQAAAEHQDAVQESDEAEMKAAQARREAKELSDDAGLS